MSPLGSIIWRFRLHLVTSLLTLSLSKLRSEFELGRAASLRSFDMDKTYQVAGEDLIEILTRQRNAAMDEVARQAAIIRTMERKLPEQSVLQFPKAAE